MATKKYMVVIAGPTAVGKTAIGIALARHFGSVILSGDSRQFYRQTNIGTAKPDTEELAEVRHYFINSLSIEQDYTAGDFERDALLLAEHLFIQHDILFVVGGSGLYLQALCEGLDHFPNTDAAVRASLVADYEREGIAFLRQELQRRDPVCYQNIDLHNPQRIMRALEVCISTGLPYSSFLTKPAIKRPFEILKIGLSMDKQILHERINKRIDGMIQAGLVDEVRALYPYRHYNALQTVGYKELFAHFDGTCTLAQAIEQIKINTRQYAKRQMTWFKKYGDWTWFEPTDLENIVTWVVNSVTF